MHAGEPEAALRLMFVHLKRCTIASSGTLNDAPARHRDRSRYLALFREPDCVLRDRLRTTAGRVTVAGGARRRECLTPLRVDLARRERYTCPSPSPRWIGISRAGDGRVAGPLADAFAVVPL